MVLARKYSDQISLKDSVAAVDQSNPKIVKNHQKLRKVKQVKHEEFSDRGIAGRYGFTNKEIDEVIRDEISSDPKLVALNRQLEEQERILSEKQKKLNGTKRYIDELIDNSPEVQAGNKELKKAREDLGKFKVDWMDHADQYLKVDSVGKEVLGSVDLAVKQNTEDKERIDAIAKARKKELSDLQGIGVKYAEYEGALTKPEQEKIAGEINRLVGDENYGDEFSDQMVEAGKAIANLFNAKGKLDKQGKKSAITSAVQDFGDGNRKLKSRAEKVFGPLSRRDAAGRLEDFVDNVEKALEQDLSKTETPKRLQNLLETGSKDSQAFYQTMFHEVVLKKMPAAQMEYFRERAIIEGDIPADDERKESARKTVSESSVVDPEENSVYDLWYKNAKRGGHLEDLESHISSRPGAKTGAGAGAGAEDEEYEHDDYEHDDYEHDDYDERSKAAKTIQSSARGSLSREKIRRNRSIISAPGKSEGGTSYQEITNGGKLTSQLNPADLNTIVSNAVEEVFKRYGMISPVTPGSHMSSAPAVQGYSPGQPLYYQGAGGQFMQLLPQQQAFSAHNPFPPQGYGYGQPPIQGSYQQGGGHYAPQSYPFAPPMHGGAPYFQQPQTYPYPPQMQGGAPYYQPQPYPYSPQMQGGAPFPNMDMNVMKSEMTKEIMDKINGDTGAADNSASRNTSSAIAAREESHSFNDGNGRLNTLERYEEAGRSDIKELPIPKVTFGDATIEQIKVSDVAKQFLLPQIVGDDYGLNKHPAKVLNNGLVVIKYGDINNFNDHIDKAAKSHGTALNGGKAKDLISIVEINDYKNASDSTYKVVVSNERGVKIHDIDVKTYKRITCQNEGNLNRPILGESRNNKMEDIMKSMLSEFCNEEHESKMSDKMKKELLDDCKNTLFEIRGRRIALPGIYGGRKDKLKAFMDDVSFTFTGNNKDRLGNLVAVDKDRQEIVIERDRIKQNRVTVTINGDPDGKEALVSIGNGCSVKVKPDGKVVADKIYKTVKGSLEEIDVGGDIWDSLSFKESPLVKTLKNNDGLSLSDAKKTAKQIMESYNKLELIVCKNGNKYDDVGLSFMIDGKTHGMELTSREAFRAGVAASLVVGGLIGVSGGIAAPAVAVGAVAVAAAPALSAGFTASITAGSIFGGAGVAASAYMASKAGGETPNPSCSVTSYNKLQERFETKTKSGI